MSELNKDYDSAIHLHTQSFDAEAKAYGLKSDPSYLQFEMDRAADVVRDARKVQKNDLVEEWQQKFLAIAYGHANDDGIYSDAVKVLTDSKEYSAARS